MKKLIFTAVLLIGVAAALAIVRKPVTGVTELAIQGGSGVTAGDGTVTNTFTITYSSIPNVVACQFGPVSSVTNFVNSITVSNFIYTANKSAVSNQWIAIGPP